MTSIVPLLRLEDLVPRARQGDRRAIALLLERFEPMVRAIAQPYYLPGADREDLLQEGRIALCAALGDYREELGRFPRFAALCIRRRIHTAVRVATRHKHEPLNRAEALSEPFGAGADEDAVPLQDALPGPAGEEPENRLLAKEQLRLLVHRTLALSDLEREALARAVNGEQLGGHTTAGRAYERARAKLLRGRVASGSQAAALRMERFAA